MLPAVIACPGCDGAVLFGTDDFGEVFLLDAEPSSEGRFVAENQNDERYRVHQCPNRLSTNDYEASNEDQN